jgi:hypothetical protein
MGASEAAKMKKEGLEPGVPDLFVIDRGVKLAMEMKPRDLSRVASPNQKRWLEHLADEELDTALCHGAEEAIRVFQEFGLDRGQHD